MGIDIRVERTFNLSEIEKIIYHPDVIRLSTEGGIKIEIDPRKACWVGTYVNDGIVGVFIFEPLNKVTLDAHCYFLPEYRKEVSSESYRLSVGWIFTNSTYEKLTVKCSQKDWHVKNFCLSNGFKLEGILEKSTIERGVLVDEYMLGMTKGQFLEYVNV